MTKFLGIAMLVAMVLVGAVLAAVYANKTNSGQSGQDAWNPLAQVSTAVPDGNDPTTAVPDGLAGDVCASYAEKHLACVQASNADLIESVTEGSDGAHAHILDQFWDQERDIALGRCENLKVAGIDVLAEAIQVCADSPCGDNGTIWYGCIMTKIAGPATTRESASDPETLAGIIREACIAEDYTAMRSYMPSTEEVAQAFSGGHEPILSSAYSDVVVLERAHAPVACSCFASLGDETPEPEMRRQQHFAQGDEVEDGVRAAKDVYFARAGIVAGPGTYIGPSGAGKCHLSFIMVNFGNGWKLLNLDT